MKNVLKLCMILALCLSVLLVAGCKSEEKKTEEPAKTPETTNGTEGEGDTTSTNPEGDPFEDTDVAVDPDDGVVEGPDPTEPPVGIQDGEGEQEDETDFDVDFGDFFG